MIIVYIMYCGKEEEWAFSFDFWTKKQNWARRCPKVSATENSCGSARKQGLVDRASQSTSWFFLRKAGARLPMGSQCLFLSWRTAFGAQGGIQEPVVQEKEPTLRSWRQFRDSLLSFSGMSLATQARVLSHLSQLLVLGNYSWHCVFTNSIGIHLPWKVQLHVQHFWSDASNVSRPVTNLGSINVFLLRTPLQSRPAPATNCGWKKSVGRCHRDTVWEYVPNRFWSHGSGGYKQKHVQSWGTTPTGSGFKEFTGFGW